jgi:hypothetical protein
MSCRPNIQNGFAGAEINNTSISGTPVKAGFVPQYLVQRLPNRPIVGVSCRATPVEN